MACWWKSLHPRAWRLRVAGAVPSQPLPSMSPAVLILDQPIAIQVETQTPGEGKQKPVLDSLQLK